jgi:enamine deaminase RidA (YjgF/YER057c/UK114 family)
VCGDLNLSALNELIFNIAQLKKGLTVRLTSAFLASIVLVGSSCCAMHAQGSSETKHVQNDAAPIATAVWAKDLLFVSGQTASPVAQADGSKQSETVYGDTKTQTISIFHKIDAILKSQNLSLKDVVSMRVYLVGIPAQEGAMDFTGFQSGYADFFSTASQPLKPARATVQVAALAHPWSLVEIEVIASKGK